MKPKLYTITVQTALPKQLTFMAYGLTKQGAIQSFTQALVSAERATDLEIMAHTRADKPILGEPAPPQQNQKELEV